MDEIQRIIDNAGKLEKILRFFRDQINANIELAQIANNEIDKIRHELDAYE